MRDLIEIAEGKTVGATVIKAPGDISEAKGTTIFLAGSIDMGRAIDWQTQISEAFKDRPVTLFNPRRDDFDPDAEQDISNPYFAEQVNWELDALDRADIIVMYFDPKGKAPITLMELGLHAASEKIAVCCPKGFWRRGNVQIICDRFDIPMVDDINALAEFVEQNI